MSNESSNIFSEVTRYLASEITLRDLEEWFVPRLGELLSDQYSNSYKLAGTVELGLAEMSIDDIDETSFRAMLREFLLTNPTISLNLSDVRTVTGSSNSAATSGQYYVSFGIMPGQPPRYERIQLGEAA